MSASCKIVVLEDDARRRAEMKAAIMDGVAGSRIVVVDNAPQFAEELAELLNGASLVSLDHDLGPSRTQSGTTVDPGVGRDVTRLLSATLPTCPIIVHSTNVFGTQGMRQDLVDAGWSVTCITPYDDLRWIREAWLPEVVRRIEV